MFAPSGCPWARAAGRVGVLVAALTVWPVSASTAQTTTTVESAAAEHGDEAVAVWWVFVAAFVVAAAVIALRARRGRGGR